MEKCTECKKVYYSELKRQTDDYNVTFREVFFRFGILLKLYVTHWIKVLETLKLIEFKGFFLRMLLKLIIDDPLQL